MASVGAFEYAFYYIYLSYWCFLILSVLVLFLLLLVIVCGGGLLWCGVRCCVFVGFIRVLVGVCCGGCWVVPLGVLLEVLWCLWGVLIFLVFFMVVLRGVLIRRLGVCVS